MPLYELIEMELLSPELVVRLKSQNGKQHVFATCLISDDWVNFQLISIGGIQLFS
jgi:hypothetical protein